MARLPPNNEPVVKFALVLGVKSAPYSKCKHRQSDDDQL